MALRVPERRRVLNGPMRSTTDDGNNGCFTLALKTEKLFCLASDGMGWEHVSVSCRHRCPTWAEMAYVKSQFWGPDDIVMQLHPRETDYVNDHPFCLHLWRPVGVELPTPPPIMVGYGRKA